VLADIGSDVLQTEPAAVQSNGPFNRCFVLKHLLPVRRIGSGGKAPRLSLSRAVAWSSACRAEPAVYGEILPGRASLQRYLAVNAASKAPPDMRFNKKRTRKRILRS